MAEIFGDRAAINLGVARLMRVYANRREATAEEPQRRPRRYSSIRKQPLFKLALRCSASSRARAPTSTAGMPHEGQLPVARGCAATAVDMTGLAGDPLWPVAAHRTVGSEVVRAADGSAQVDAQVGRALMNVVGAMRSIDPIDVAGLGAIIAACLMWWLCTE